MSRARALPPRTDRLAIASSFVRASSGESLDRATATAMRRHFTLPLDHVRVHRGPEAEDAARALHARAFTFGHHVVLGRQVELERASGRATLVHELAHVAQQRGGGDQPHEAPVGAEREARDAVGRLAAGRTAGVPSVYAGPMLACQEEGGPVDEYKELEGFFAEDEPMPERPSDWSMLSTDELMKRAKNRADYQRKLKLLERWRKEHPAQLVKMDAIADREPEMESWPNAVIFDGAHLMVRRKGKVIATAGAVSGNASQDDERAKGSGPLPDGTYQLSPQIKMPAIAKFQSGGIGGAHGIDHGYQVIIDPSVQGVWGAQRIRIEGAKLGRDGFFIHGGQGSTTSGCIKHHSDTFWAELLKFGASIPLVVQKINRPPRHRR